MHAVKKRAREREKREKGREKTSFWLIKREKNEIEKQINKQNLIKRHLNWMRVHLVEEL